MISTIITAGGISSRFGSNKLLEKINGKSVIEHTILNFIDFSDEIIIPATPQTKEFIEKSCVFNNKITFAPAGKTRKESVYNGLKMCKFKDYVLIHDGARPYISKETIKSVIEAVKAHKAVCTGKMAVDTIKTINERGFIEKTIDRRLVFQAQTPQAFEFDVIFSAHEKFLCDDSFTDDSSLVEALGKKVFALLSSGANDKITTRQDLNSF